MDGDSESGAFCEGLLAQNGNTIAFEKNQIPASLRIGAMMLLVSKQNNKILKNTNAGIMKVPAFVV